MKEREEDKLVKRMLDLFENFEEDSADLGWTELRKKYPEKNKRRPLMLWFSSAAALLLVVAGFWFIDLAYEKVDDKPVVKIKKIPSSTESADRLTNKPVSKATDAKLRDYGNLVTGYEKIITRKPKSSSHHLQVGSNRGNYIAIRQPARSFVLVPEERLPIKDKSTTAENNKPDTATVGVVLSSNNYLIPQPFMPDSITNVKGGKQTITAVTSNTFVVTTEPENNPSNASKKDIEPKKKPVTFDVFTGPFISFASGSTNSFNTAAGLSSDIRLSGGLNISTGISIAQNNFSFNGSIPVKSSKFADFYSQPVQSNAVNNQSSITTTSVEAKLLGLDIPVNLKYKFSASKNEFFVSAGFSSNTFINESYTYYNTVTSQNTAMLTAANETITNKFKSFSLARTLNLSFGLGYPVGKTERLFIEPFLKYPLGGLGARDIRFGSTGINLKLNFSKGSK